jgi:competence protein ComEC
VRRPLLVVAALFGCGSLLGARGGGAAEAFAILGFACCLLLAGVLARRGGAAGAALAAAAFGLGAAAATIESLQFERTELRRLLRSDHGGEGRADDAVTARLTGVIVGDPAPVDGHRLVVLDAERVEIGTAARPAAGLVRVEVGGETPWPNLGDGERLALWARLRSASGDGARDGTVAYGYCKSARLAEPLGRAAVGPLRRAVAAVRSRARRTILQNLPAGPERGLVLAMVLGDRSEIDEETADAFRASGTYHVLALSGAQVALVAGLIVAGLRRALVPPWGQALVAAPALAFYALLVGAEVPVVRAAVMACALLVGRALELDSDAANLLGAAGLALLVQRPSCGTDVGFQLSFGATLGILMLTGPIARGMPRLPLRADLALTASLAAQVALTPVLASSFHRVAPAALLLNLAAVPLSSAVLFSGAALVVIGPLGGLPAWAVGSVAWWAARVLRRSGDLGPLGAYLDLRVPGPSFGVLALHALGLVLLARGRRAAGLGTIALALAAVVVGPLRPAADDRLHLFVLDVGQGDSLLLRSPGGRALLIDAGGSRDRRFDPGERRVAPFLWAAGLRRLDGLLLTHAHPDHAGGVPYVLRAFPTEELWEGPAPLRDPVWQRIEAAFPRGPTRRTLVRGMRLDWEGARLAVVGPVPPRRAPLRIRNEDSVVLDVAYGEVHLLLTGDVTGEAERALAVGPAPVLKVPHHGSATSSGEGLLVATRPQVAIVSVGAHNPFGHPHPNVLARYRRSGALLLRTDRDGTVDVATDGRRIWVRAAGEGQERRVR